MTHPTLPTEVLEKMKAEAQYLKQDIRELLPDVKYKGVSKEGAIKYIEKELDTLIESIAEQAVIAEREAWLKGNRCSVCGDSNLDSKGLSDICAKCFENA